MPHETHIRVRYTETDQMGFVHHSNYMTYFEIARTEMLRDACEDGTPILRDAWRRAIDGGPRGDGSR